MSAEAPPRNENAAEGMRPRLVATSAYTFGLLGIGFAAWDWGFRDVAIFAGVAVGVAFLAELVVVSLGMLDHEIEPQVAGVPLAALFGWMGVTSFAYRLALDFGSAFPAWLPAPVLAGLLATLADAFVERRAVDGGAWRYPDHALSTPRLDGIPWWNYAGWLAFTALVCALAGALGVP